MIPHLFTVFFIQHNPPRSQAIVVETMFLLTPIISAIAAATTLLTFAIPQYAQRLLENVPLQRVGRKYDIGILLTLPVTALLSWYCFDYIVMSGLSTMFQDDDDQSYEHGITPRRYLLAVGAQTVMTLISLFYSRFRPRSAVRRGSAIAAAALGLGVGMMPGHSQVQVHG
jgi:MFS family permease